MTPGDPLSEAQAAFLKGNPKEILRLAETELRAHPDSFRGWSLKGFALGELNLPGEIECYRQMISLQPMFAEGYYDAANFYHGNGRLQLARPLYRRAIRLLDRKRDAHFAEELFHAYVDLLMQLGNKRGAMNVLRRGINHPAVSGTVLLRDLQKSLRHHSGKLHNVRRRAAE